MVDARIVLVHLSKDSSRVSECFYLPSYDEAVI